MPGVVEVQQEVPEVFALSYIGQVCVCVFVCGHISPCHLHPDKVTYPINLSTAFFSLLPTFITRFSSMSDLQGGKKLSHRASTITILAC